MPVSFARRLLLLSAAGLLLRLAWVALEPATDPVADETMWLTWGVTNLTSPEVAFSPRKLRFIFHPPLYLYFVGLVHATFGSLLAIKLAQAALGATLVPALALLGRRAYGESAGLAAGAIAAFYPELVWFTSHFWAETVFTVVLWWAMERLSAAAQSGSRRTAALAGVLFGLAVLTRETVLYFVPLAALWLASCRSGDERGLGRRLSGAGLRRGAVFLAASVLVVVPWTVRNAVVFGAFVPVSTAGALNVWQGNTYESRQQVYEEYWAIHGKIARYELARRKGIQAVLERQPWWIFEKLNDEMPAYWQAHGQPIVHIERGAYGRVPRPIAMTAIAVVLLPYLVVLALFVAGIAVLPRQRANALLLGFLAFYVLLHVASHGYPRYRLPSLPVLFLVAGSASSVWCSPRSVRPRSLTTRGRLGAAAAVAVVLALAVGPSLVGWVRGPWPPPWFAHNSEAPTSEAPGADAR